MVAVLLARLSNTLESARLDMPFSQLAADGHIKRAQQLVEQIRSEL